MEQTSLVLIFFLFALIVFIRMLQVALYWTRVLKPEERRVKELSYENLFCEIIKLF